ncbi:MAG: RNA-binding domain-containing protein [Halopseudomonas yangmingensis]|uniref:ATP-dependent DNA helicase RecG n=1 Tax=Halopseudomonas yangmingensis TaxID=1720063 RepID=A0A1I4TVE4_9GAMM|nr:RNA-binding domain-containing protein [Halopseudomonas yangmingensis]SFM80684.1 ATP-dependent DNA helicase RecG [Halopseudomonas yangmingensis]
MCSQRPQWLPERESMRVEFKSDRALLSDRDIAAALACLANAEGGELWLGLEDDARIGGLHPLRGPLADLLERLCGCTHPPLRVSGQLLRLGQQSVLKFRVDAAYRPVYLLNGQLLRRRLKHDGTPECVSLNGNNHHR